MCWDRVIDAETVVTFVVAKPTPHELQDIELEDTPAWVEVAASA